jgi:hypothetical protein
VDADEADQGDVGNSESLGGPREGCAVISQHDDVRRSRLLVGVEQPTTNQRRHTRDAKCSGREYRRLDQTEERRVSASS